MRRAFEKERDKTKLRFIKTFKKFTKLDKGKLFVKYLNVKFTRGHFLQL